MTEQNTILDPEVDSGAILEDTSDFQEATDTAAMQSIIEEANEIELSSGVAPEPNTETTPETVPKTVPDPVTPSETIPVVPSELETLRQQNQFQQQQLEQAERARQTQELQVQTQQRADELQNLGVMPTEAAQIAQSELGYRQQAIDAQQQARQYVEHHQGKINAAAHYAKLHNVDSQTLMQFNTPQGMEQAAISQSRIGKLEAEISAMKRGRVTPQSFDNGQANPIQSSNIEKLVDSANSKAPHERTEAENKAMAQYA